MKGDCIRCPVVHNSLDRELYPTVRSNSGDKLTSVLTPVQLPVLGLRQDLAKIQEIGIVPRLILFPFNLLHAGMGPLIRAVWGQRQTTDSHRL
jgi:hypothetical protein